MNAFFWISQFPFTLIFINARFDGMTSFGVWTSLSSTGTPISVEV